MWSKTKGPNIHCIFISLFSCCLVLDAEIIMKSAWEIMETKTLVLWTEDQKKDFRSWKYHGNCEKEGAQESEPLKCMSISIKWYMKSWFHIWTVMRWSDLTQYQRLWELNNGVDHCSGFQLAVAWVHTWDSLK